MRLISLNTGGGRLFAALDAYLRATDADLWCLQEVTRAPPGAAAWADFVDGDVRLPQRADLFADVRAALPAHDGLFAPAATGTLVDAAGRAVASDFGLASFVRATVPVIAQRVAFVHGAYSPQGWGDHPRPRNAHALRLFDRPGGRPVTIVQLHGLRDPAGKHDTPARAAQARALVDLIEATRAGPEEATVVCGDLNLLPDSATFALLAEIGLVDQVTARGFADTRTSHYRKPGRHANYLLVNAAVAVRRFDVPAAPEVSDHRALVLDFT